MLCVQNGEALSGEGAPGEVDRKRRKKRRRSNFSKIKSTY